MHAADRLPAGGDRGSPRSPRGLARTTADTLLRRSPAQAYFTRRARSRLTVLGYHGVDDPESFARQLDRLRRAADIVSLDEVEDAIASRRPLPGRAVLVTFDDGERSVVESGLPLLRERGMPAVAFVVAGLIGTDEPFWWHEVELLVRAGAAVPGEPQRTVAEWLRHLKGVPQAERVALLDALRSSAASRDIPVRQPQLTAADLAALEAGGVRVENHSLTHPLLDRCDDRTVVDEIVDAHLRLSAVLGRAPRAFAYPNGNWDVRAERRLGDLGYRTAFLFDHRTGPRLPDHPLRISRLRVSTTASPARFETLLSGLHPALHALRGGR